MLIFRKNGTTLSRRGWQVSMGLLLILAVGCAPLQRRAETRRSVEATTPSTNSQQDVSVVLEKDDLSLAEDEGFRGQPPQNVGLILGPGAMKTFAHAGVLKALKRGGIPIHTIIGLEWGSLVAALYSQKEQEHDVEWRLYKLEQRDLPRRGRFSQQIQAANIQSLQKFFQENLTLKQIEQAAIPFACPSLSWPRSGVVWQSRGPFDEALRRCIPFPPLYHSTEPWTAAAFALREAINFFESQGVDLVIFVNVLGEGELLDRDTLLADMNSAILWYELRRSLRRDSMGLEVITVDTSGIHINAFDKRQQLVGLGEQAGQRAAERLTVKYGF